MLFKIAIRVFMKNLRSDIIFCMMGFSAIVGQILLLRRLMAVFGGNELVVGAVFFGWVFWAGLGNLIMGRVTDRIEDIPHLLSLLINLTALILPATILATSMSKVGLGYPPSQLVGLPVVVIVSAVVLGPFCFLVGAGLTVAAKLPATGKARDIGTMYLFDALGAGLGGIVATWFAIRVFTPLQIALLTTLIMVFLNSAILVRRLTTQVLTALIALLAVATLWIAPGIDALITETKWKGYHPIVDIDSRYGNLVVSEQGEEHTLFVDGVPQFSTPFPDTYETEAILPLLMHSDPKDVLVIGGGLSGMLANWRSINLESIVYVQVDPDVTALEGNLMTSREAMEDERLKIVHLDAPHFMRRLVARGCKDGCFDVVILASGDPDTAAASRLLTESFFERIKKSLKSDGVLSFGVFQPGNAIGPEAAKLLGTVRATVGNVFDHLVVLPFDKFYFIASPSEGMLTDDPEQLKDRLVERAIVAPVLEGQHIASIFPERIQSMRKVIDMAAKRAPMNTELRPAAYFNGLLLWASRTGGLGLKLLYSAERFSWIWFVTVLVVAAALSILLGYKRKKRLLKISSFWMLFSIGFAAIIYEIVLLVYYQLQEGLLFYQLGIIITAFMVGLSCGAFVSIRVFKRYKIKSRYLVIGLLIFTAYQPLLFFMAGISFALANFLCGVMEGFLFEATAEWMVAQREQIGKTTGWLNCADYWGSAIGSILAAIITVPLLGLIPSMLVAAALPLTAAIVLSTNRAYQ
jgi:spermidine synthase